MRNSSQTATRNLKRLGLQLVIVGMSLVSPVAGFAQPTLQGEWNFDDDAKPALDTVTKEEAEIQGSPAPVKSPFHNAMRFQGDEGFRLMAQKLAPQLKTS